MARAIWQGEVIAESDETVVVEGNHYFPQDSVRHDVLTPSSTHSVCPWKGTASYYTVSVNGHTNPDYPQPKPGAEQVADRIAFWNGVTVEA